MKRNNNKTFAVELQIGNSFPLGWLIIGLLAFLAFFSSIAQAQTAVQKIESVGFTVSDMDKAIDFYTRILPFEKVSETETFGSYSATQESKIKMGYINIPLMMKYYATDALSLELGPQIGLLMSANTDSTYTSNFPGDTNSSRSTDVKSNFKSTNFGLNIGAGYGFGDNFSAGLWYSLGLTSVNNIADDATTPTVNEGKTIKNNVISVNFGYSF